MIFKEDEMILFSTDETQVKVLIDSGHRTENTDGWLNSCGWDFKSEVVAKVMRDHLAGRLYETVQTIRKEEYEEGYQDHRQKKRKKRTFSGCL